jgi:hypothetical protein
VSGDSRDPAARFGALVARCEADPSAVAAARADGDVLAADVGGELALRWRVACVRALIAAPPDGDAVREAYGELLDRYRDDAAAMTALRALGDDIRKLEAQGTLPRALVARSDRKRRVTPR